MTWKELISKESNKEYYKKINKKLESEYLEKEIYPKKNQIFKALELTPLEEVKVVILGQDPYHGEGEAHGLAFSVNKGVRIPPSLKNIYKELAVELGLKIPTSGNLEKWARQGVLLLNATLTVEKDKPASHSKIGWQKFTDVIIKEINEKETPVVFMLWGNYARGKKDLITNKKHLVLESVHPSPLSARRGFFGCNHFIKANEFLKNNCIKEIDWQIED